MSIIAANMDNCDVKFRCQTGVNKGVAYSVKEPCFDNQTFDAALCDCLPYFECDCSCGDGCQDCQICVGGQCVLDPACDNETAWCLNVTTGQCNTDGDCRTTCFPIEEGVPFGVAVRVDPESKYCGDSGCGTRKVVIVTYSDGSEAPAVVMSGCCECVEFKADPYITYRDDGIFGTFPCDSSTVITYSASTAEGGCLKDGGSCGSGVATSKNVFYGFYDLQEEGAGPGVMDWSTNGTGWDTGQGIEGTLEIGQTVQSVATFITSSNVTAWSSPSSTAPLYGEGEECDYCGAVLGSSATLSFRQWTVPQGACDGLDLSECFYQVGPGKLDPFS